MVSWYGRGTFSQRITSEEHIEMKQVMGKHEKCALLAKQMELVVGTLRGKHWHIQSIIGWP